MAQASKKTHDVAAEGQACYRLGLAHTKSKGQYDIAIKYLNQYVSSRNNLESCTPGSSSNSGKGLLLKHSGY